MSTSTCVLSTRPPEKAEDVGRMLANEGITASSACVSSCDLSVMSSSESLTRVSSSGSFDESRSLFSRNDLSFSSSRLVSSSSSCAMILAASVVFMSSMSSTALWKEASIAEVSDAIAEVSVGSATTVEPNNAELLLTEADTAEANTGDGEADTGASLGIEEEVEEVESIFGSDAFVPSIDATSNVFTAAANCAVSVSSFVLPFGVGLLAFDLKGLMSSMHNLRLSKSFFEGVESSF